MIVKDAHVSGVLKDHGEEEKGEPRLPLSLIFSFCDLGINSLVGVLHQGVYAEKWSALFLLTCFFLSPLPALLICPIPLENNDFPYFPPGATQGVRF